MIADQPIAKLLFNRNGDYAISQSYDARSLRYEYVGNLLVVQIQSNNSMGVNEFMYLRKDQLRKHNSSFAIDAYGTDNVPDRFFCVQKSSESLQSLIDKCYGKIILRELTEEERKQIQEFKAIQKGKEFTFFDEIPDILTELLFIGSESSFKLVFKKRGIETKTAGLISFEFRGYFVGAKREFYVFVDNYHPGRSYIRLIGPLAEKSFVIEKLPLGKYKCRHTGLPDLKPVECNGQIKLRELNADE